MRTATEGQPAYDNSPTWRGPTRIGFVATAMLALGYAPLAITYMWRYFSPGAPQLQASLTTAIDGRAYAVGHGSVDWLRSSAYHDNAWVMVVHTTLGGVSLILAVIQFLPITRRHLRFHRWCGRLFIVSMTASMLTAVSFLVLADVGAFAYAPALRLQLWVLGLTCLGTGWTAAVMARRGRVAAHQGFALLCFAFLMTAPGLRALWVGLHAVFPHALLVGNLVGGAIAETVLAPSLGVMAFILTRPPSPVSGAPEPTRDGPVEDVLISATAVVATAAHYRATVAGLVPPELFWCHLAPVAVVLGVCLLLETRSIRSGSSVTGRRWRTLYHGVLASTVATNATWFVGAPAVGQAGAYVASAMVTTGIPITIAGLILIREITPSEGQAGTAGGRGLAARSRSWIGRPPAVPHR